MELDETRDLPVVFDDEYVLRHGFSRERRIGPSSINNYTSIITKESRSFMPDENPLLFSSSKPPIS